MSEEIDNTEELSDKELNFKALREAKEALESELATLRPLAVKDAIRAAGFDPDKPEGKALARLAETADAESVKALAEELGFEVPTLKPELTPTEQAAVAGAQKQAALNSVTTSDGPPSSDQAIAEAEAAGDYGLSGRLKLQQFLSANQ
jgi:hypothetical protein